MSIQITGMKMPTEPLILILYPDGKIATEDWDIGANAKAIELPPHGRLIDADALTNRVGSYMPIKWTYEYGSVVSLNDIYHAPTIIEAEESGE